MAAASTTCRNISPHRRRLPEHLTWFKWEAYLTWVTGFFLLAVVYYFNASANLIDPAVADLAPWQAIVISLVSIIAGWAIYDGLCRSPIGRNTGALAACVFALILGFAYVFTHLFSGRGAFIHVGVIVGTIMAANVFMVIIPNQRKITAALMPGEAPDPRLGAIGKQRSLHNTYLTLPVLLMMVSQPLLHAHQRAQCLDAGRASSSSAVRRSGTSWCGTRWATRCRRSPGRCRSSSSRSALRVVAVRLAAALARLGQPVHPLGPHDRRHRLDRHVLLFRGARLLAPQGSRPCRRVSAARRGRCMAAASTTCGNI